MVSGSFTHSELPILNSPTYTALFKVNSHRLARDATRPVSCVVSGGVNWPLRVVKTDLSDRSAD